MEKMLLIFHSLHENNSAVGTKNLTPIKKFELVKIRWNIKIQILVKI